MAPTPYWSVSSILYALNEDFYILIDCGEGTYV